MLRIIVDLGAAACAFAMVFRMRPFVTPFALRFGLMASVLTVAGQLVVAATALNVAGYRPDIGAAAIIFAFTVGSRGHWERYVATDYLRDSSATVNDLHGRYLGAVATAVLLGLMLDWAVGVGL
jgi:hypothetical protein